MSRQYKSDLIFGSCSLKLESQSSMLKYDLSRSSVFEN